MKQKPLSRKRDRVLFCLFLLSGNVNGSDIHGRRADIAPLELQVASDRPDILQQLIEIPCDGDLFHRFSLFAAVHPESFRDQGEITADGIKACMKS